MTHKLLAKCRNVRGKERIFTHNRIICSHSKLLLLQTWEEMYEHVKRRKKLEKGPKTWKHKKATKASTVPPQRCCFCWSEVPGQKEVALPVCGEERKIIWKRAKFWSFFWKVRSREILRAEQRKEMKGKTTKRTKKKAITLLPLLSQ